MKRFTLPLLVVMICCAGRAFGQDYRFAMGLRISTSTPIINTSASGKYFITDKNAVEGLVSFGSGFGLGAMLETHRHFDTEGLSWFYGAGVFLGFRDKNGYFGPAGIGGLDYKFTGVPVNLSLDWKPELDIIPNINFVPDAFALSLRFTLK